MYFAGQESLRKSKTSQSDGDLRTFRMSRKSRVFPNRHGRSTTVFRYSVYENNGVKCEKGVTNGLLAPYRVRLFTVKTMGPTAEYRTI